jgi:hypothetical protein
MTLRLCAAAATICSGALAGQVHERPSSLAIGERSALIGLILDALVERQIVTRALSDPCTRYHRFNARA